VFCLRLQLSEGILVHGRKVKAVRLELIHVVLPMLIGGFTYLLFRADTLLMFQWVDSLGLSGPLAEARAAAAGFGAVLPDWFLFSLPDAAWLYAFGAQMVILHRESRLLVRVCWVVVAPVLAIGAEFGQAFGWVPGTFDMLDVLLLSIVTFGVVVLERCVASRPAPLFSE
jgi:hypothetical protein